MKRIGLLWVEQLLEVNLCVHCKGKQY